MGHAKRHLKAVATDGTVAADPWEQRFRLLAGSVRALISLHDAAGSFLYASPLVSELTGVPPDTLIGSPVQALVHPEDGERVMAVHRAWMAPRGDKTTTLALAWAREQLRLGLQGVIEATPPSARGTLTLPADTLAWLLLAACESLAHEPPSAAADRLRLLLQLTGRPDPSP